MSAMEDPGLSVKDIAACLWFGGAPCRSGFTFWGMLHSKVGRLFEFRRTTTEKWIETGKAA